MEASRKAVQGGQHPEKPANEQVDSAKSQQGPEVAGDNVIDMDAARQGNTSGSTTEKGESKGVQLIVGGRFRQESDVAVVACNDWLRMGPGRSLRALHAVYTQRPGARETIDEMSSPEEKVATGGAKKAKPTDTDQNQPNIPRFVTDRLVGDPPTKSIATLKDWSYHFEWKQRSREYDAPFEDLRDVEHQRAMRTGFALTSYRVSALNDLAQMLHKMVMDKKNLWVAGPNETKVFNAPLFKAYRSVLADIAAETGGRREHSDNIRMVKEAIERIDFSKLSAEQSRRFFDGENPLFIILEPYLKKEE